MRLLALLLLSLSLSVKAAPDPLEAAYRIANSGAPQLALERVERLQPQAGKESWADWEWLRLHILARLQRHQDLLARVAMLPHDAPSHLAKQAFVEGVRTALKTGKPALARIYTARLLWQFPLSEQEYRQARLQVIESYLAESRGLDAYHAMLRYQQDFKPLAKAQALKFAEGLAASRMENEAAAWLAYLDEASPLKLLLRLKAGLVPPEAAVTQARKALKKNPGPGYWAVLLHAGALLKDTGLRLEALEQLLNHQDGGSSPAFAAKSAELWQEYLASAQAIANRNQLLGGDDMAWLDLAGRSHAASPSPARALLAHLALNARFPEVRHTAQLQLVSSLQRHKLGHTAILLFGDDQRTPLQSVDASARYILGILAADNARLAASFWKGLPAPQDLSRDEWPLMQAAVFVKAGMMKDAVAALGQLLGGKEPLPREAAKRVLVLAEEMLNARDPGAAEQVLLRLFDLVEPLQKREALFALGTAAEFRNQSRLAADYFLQAATLIENKTQDAVAKEARLRSAMNLARAGFREDARAQFQWLMKASKDRRQQEEIRRELDKL